MEQQGERACAVVSEDGSGGLDDAMGQQRGLDGGQAGHERDVCVGEGGEVLR